MQTPTYSHEEEHGARRGQRIAGVDEAGRGPWAGPVVAAAVILDPANLPVGVADSKGLTPEAREAACARLLDDHHCGVGIADVERIDRDNILQATHWAMCEAVRALGLRPDTVLVDGNRAPAFGCPTVTLVKGDAHCLSIAAASIVAKVTRDRIMCELAAADPRYGFERHKGYGTQAHRDALDRYGPSPHHRQSFQPIQRALAKQTSGQR